MPIITIHKPAITQTFRNWTPEELPVALSRWFEVLEATYPEEDSFKIIVSDYRSPHSYRRSTE
jgi:hypothetical protein